MSKSEINITCTLKKVELNSLDENLKILYHKAIEAKASSYSPYSGFPVGAAVLHNDNSIVLGSNQENAAYPSGLCAERTALFYSRANYSQKKVTAIAVAVDERNDFIPIPCGSCLQVIAEFEKEQDRNIQLLLMQPSKSIVWLANGVDNLLPFSFGKKHLLK